ncbi:MAG: bifunctional diaminohydroxyphosphoribosylaminopyrimidine deaminase/5-amino-6-(5-phosphoribosylamino)uracil reductase RibD [Actinobacteria bacterium]|nr:bifunctional diaminohydroxyphosphoribosylaminopyrimidine deaminase/5-amino-6-(5-phosphoribosylamino)uracil reductase RibD [Actinomycetota bacterium]
MRLAIAAADASRLLSRPNPWVGAVLLAADGRRWTGATEPPGARHAEIVALDAAGAAARGSTLVTTLEPCCTTGRTGPCTEAIVRAGVARVVVGTEDPDPGVRGRGIAALRAAGVAVDVGARAAEVEEQLAPYLHHRRTGRPFVVLKMACTADGRTAAADGSSRWITGPDARRRVHRMRAESDAVLVGAGTVRADDPMLTVRDADGPSPRRIVLGTAPAGAHVHPCLEWGGGVPELLDHLGGEGVLQLLVEGGRTVAASFHAAGLVDRYVLHVAPRLAGGDGAPGLFTGAPAATVADLWDGEFVRASLVGGDLEVVLAPRRAGGRT